MQEKKEGQGMYVQTEEAMIRNLEDAGCSQSTIAGFMESVHKGNIPQGLKVLAAHRRFLLDNLHKGQKQIDCLDYLIYQIEKQA